MSWKRAEALIVLGVVVLILLLVFRNRDAGGGGGSPSWAVWDDSCPAWSPDGKKIAFASSRAEYWHNKNGWHQKTPDPVPYDLYAMNADGTHVRRLTYVVATRGAAAREESVDFAAPIWSADGRSIFFFLTSNDGRRPYAINSTGRPRMRPAHWSDLAGQLRYPGREYTHQDECVARSPRGNEVAFYRPVDNDAGLGGTLWGLIGIICRKNAQRKAETLTQGLGTLCPNTTVS